MTDPYLYYDLARWSAEGKSLEVMAKLKLVPVSVMKSWFVRGMASGEHPDLQWPMYRGVRIDLSKPQSPIPAGRSYSPRVNPELREKARELRSQGLSFAEIGRRLGVSQSYAVKSCKD